MEQLSRQQRWHGFTLMELMVVVLIIGVLAGIGIPRYRLFITKGRQAEAIQNLANIHSLQKSYSLRMQGLGHGDNIYHSGLSMGNGDGSGTCNSSATSKQNTLGFRVEDCSRLRYTYSTDAWTTDDKATNSGSSNPIYPDCTGAGKVDTWTMGLFG